MKAVSHMMKYSCVRDECMSLCSINGTSLAVTYLYMQEECTRTSNSDSGMQNSKNAAINGMQHPLQLVHFCSRCIYKLRSGSSWFLINEFIFGNIYNYS
jgi:hypothetical protein